MTILEGKPHRGTLHQRMVEDIPLGPINVPVLIAQGAADKIVTATSADGIQDVATHTYESRGPNLCLSLPLASFL
jgi:alpha-beta hydrolase superfamily lysophospholipase